MFRQRLFYLTDLFWLTLIFWLLMGAPGALAGNHGYDPSDPRTKWMELKLRPDIGTSCCGKHDAYFFDRYEELPGGELRVWLEAQGETRYPDGGVRPAIEKQDVIVPRSNVNPLDDDIDNPWDRSVIWVTVHEGKVTRVWCAIRHPQGY